MNNLNSVLIEGKLVQDPVFHTSEKGQMICSFSLGSSRYFKQDDTLQEEVGYFEVESFGKLAEHCRNLGRKERGVRVVGRMRQDRWESEDGKKHSRVIIIADHVEFRPEYQSSPMQEELIEMKDLKETA